MRTVDRVEPAGVEARQPASVTENVGGKRRVDVEQHALINPFTQQQIADITGQTSVNVNRVFADLERQGLISRNGREITFKDWNEIQRVGSFHADYLN